MGVKRSVLIVTAKPDLCVQTLERQGEERVKLYTPFAEYLEGLGCSVAVAKDTEEGLAKFRETHPDFIIGDWQMSGMFATIKQENKNQPVGLLLAQVPRAIGEVHLVNPFADMMAAYPALKEWQRGGTASLLPFTPATQNPDVPATHDFIDHAALLAVLRRLPEVGGILMPGAPVAHNPKVFRTGQA